MTALKAATVCLDGRNVRIHAGIVVSIDIVIGPLALPAPRPVRATQVLRPPRLMAQRLPAARVAPLSTRPARLDQERALLHPGSTAGIRCPHDGARACRHALSPRRDALPLRAE